MTGESQQLWLFDVGKFELEQADFSGLPHFPEPRCDNERLLEYQYQYKTTGDKKALNGMFHLGFTVAYKYINQQTRGSKQLKRLSTADRETKAADAINYIVMAEISKPGWYINESFTGYLWRRVLHELRYRRKVDEIVDFVDLSLFFKEQDETLYGAESEEEIGWGTEDQS